MYDDEISDAEEFWDMDDPDYYESEDAIIGYECMCCGNVQTTSGMGDTCDRCCGPVSEMYE